MSHSRHVTLSYAYADRSVHVTALLVHSKNSFWGTQTKNTVKDKCGISFAKDTSADAVFGFVPHILKSPQLLLLNACARRGHALALLSAGTEQRAFLAQEAEKSLNQGHCPVLQGK